MKKFVILNSRSSLNGSMIYTTYLFNALNVALSESKVKSRKLKMKEEKKKATVIPEYNPTSNLSTSHS